MLPSLSRTLESGGAKVGRYGICIDCTPGAPNFILVHAFNATDDGANPPVRTIFLKLIGSHGSSVSNLRCTSQVSLYNYTFPTLGVHEIIIQNMPDPQGNPINNSQITIDRIELTVPGTTSIITTTLTDITSTPTPSITTTTSTTTSASIQPSKSGPASLPSPTSPVGAIVGGALGALALLIGVAFFLYRRRSYRIRVLEEDLRARSAPFEELPTSHIPQFRDEPQLSRPGVTVLDGELHGRVRPIFSSPGMRRKTQPHVIRASGCIHQPLQLQLPLRHRHRHRHLHPSLHLVLTPRSRHLLLFQFPDYPDGSVMRGR